MSDNFAPTHHKVTSDLDGQRSTGAYGSNTVGDNYNITGTGYNNEGSSYGQRSSGYDNDNITRTGVSSSDRPEFTGAYAGRNDDTITSADAPVSRDRLNSEYEPRTEIDQQRGSLASTQGPFQTPTTDDVDKSDAPLTSSVGSQNAPHAGGRAGEAAMGALGYGGASVERPKEEQGLAEKIVNFMGA